MSLKNFTDLRRASTRKVVVVVGATLCISGAIGIGIVFGFFWVLGVHNLFNGTVWYLSALAALFIVILTILIFMKLQQHIRG